jgi:hypothetical protein
MKRFKTWYLDNDSPPEITDGEDYYHYRGAELGWKLALEWVQEMGQDNILRRADIKIWEEIEEELND